MGPFRHKFVPSCTGQNVPFPTTSDGHVCLPKQKKMHHFVGKFPHWEPSLVDALHCPLAIVMQPSSMSVLVPFWVLMSWWSLWMKLVHPPPKPNIGSSVSRNVSKLLGEYMLPPRWPLLCTVLSELFTGAKNIRWSNTSLSCEFKKPE